MRSAQSLRGLRNDPGAPLALTRTNDEKLVPPLPSCALVVRSVRWLVGSPPSPFLVQPNSRERCCRRACTAPPHVPRQPRGLRCQFVIFSPSVSLSLSLSLRVCVCFIRYYYYYYYYIRRGSVVHYYIIVAVRCARFHSRRRRREKEITRRGRRRGAPPWVGKYLSRTCRIVAGGSTDRRRVYRRRRRASQ